MRFRTLVIVGSAVLGWACGSSHEMGSPMMTGPTGSMAGTQLRGVSPHGGSVGVSVGATLSISFSHAMLSGMERYVDLHEGDVDGPQVPIRCAWSSDRETLTCTPDSPLKAHTRYTLHIGGGMMDADDHPVDFGSMGPQMGGQWLMGGAHHGSMMGSGWRGSNGSYGMFFTFTTA